MSVFCFDDNCVNAASGLGRILSQEMVPETGKAWICALSAAKEMKMFRIVLNSIQRINYQNFLHCYL